MADKLLNKILIRKSLTLNSVFKFPLTKFQHHDIVVELGKCFTSEVSPKIRSSFLHQLASLDDPGTLECKHMRKRQKNTFNKFLLPGRWVLLAIYLHKLFFFLKVLIISSRNTTP